MTHILKHSLFWESARLMTQSSMKKAPREYRKPADPDIKTLHVSFTKNAAVFCSLEELKVAVKAIDVIKEAVIYCTPSEGEATQLYKPASSKNKKDTLFFEPPEPIRKIEFTPQAVAMTTLYGMKQQYLVVIYGSCLELLDYHTVTAILNSEACFEEVCALWALPETLIPMFKSLCVVAKDSLGASHGTAPILAGV